MITKNTTKRDSKKILGGISWRSFLEKFTWVSHRRFALFNLKLGPFNKGKI